MNNSVRRIESNKQLHLTSYSVTAHFLYFGWLGLFRRCAPRANWIQRGNPIHTRRIRAPPYPSRIHSTSYKSR